MGPLPAPTADAESVAKGMIDIWADIRAHGSAVPNMRRGSTASFTDGVRPRTPTLPPPPASRRRSLTGRLVTYVAPNDLNKPRGAGRPAGRVQRDADRLAVALRRFSDFGGRVPTWRTELWAMAATLANPPAASSWEGPERRALNECRAYAERMRHQAVPEATREAERANLADIRDDIVGYRKQDDTARTQGWLQWAHTAVDAVAGAAHASVRKDDGNIDTKGARGYTDELRDQRRE